MEGWDVGAFMGPAAGLGFGGLAGAIVGYTGKKVAKLLALVLGLVFILLQVLVYVEVVSVDWGTVQATAEQAWSGEQGATLANRAWEILTANLTFGAGFAAGVALGFKLG